MRFRKIDGKDYYLSYSGGKDSELLRYFIRNVLKHKDIPIVAVNTYREHSEIRELMYRNSDTILKPLLSMDQIKERYGIPCFTKMQDEIIERYQKGSRATYTMNRLMGVDTVKFGVNKTARSLTLSGRLHRVSNKCCKYTKKEPLRLYEKESGRKAIIGTRGSESITRKNAYRTCLSKKGKFSPMFDFTDEMIELLYEYWKIDIPSVYKVLDRTGCIGCPYGYHGKKLTLTELSMVSPSQRKYAIDSFGESYRVLGIALHFFDEVKYGDHHQLRLLL